MDVAGTLRLHGPALTLSVKRQPDPAASQCRPGGQTAPVLPLGGSAHGVHLHSNLEVVKGSPCRGRSCHQPASSASKGPAPCNLTRVSRIEERRPCLGQFRRRATSRTFKHAGRALTVRGNTGNAETHLLQSRRWLQHLALHVQSRQVLLQSSVLALTISAALIAVRDNLAQLSSGGGSSGGKGGGGPAWRWRHGNWGGEERSERQHLEGIQEGEGEEEEEEEEQEEEEETKPKMEVFSERELPFAHIGGGLQGRGFEPRGADTDEEDDEGTEEEEGMTEAEDAIAEAEEVTGEDMTAKKTARRMYSDLPPGFESEVVVEEEEASLRLAEGGAETGLGAAESRGPSSELSGSLLDSQQNGALQSSSFAAPSSVSSAYSPSPEARQPMDEPSDASVVPERKGSLPGHSVGNWFAGVFGAVLGRRPGSPPPAAENELVSAQETIQKVVEMLTSQEGDDALAMRGDINALRRLQRETFAQLLEMRERLSKLEFHTGLRNTRGRPSLPAFAAHLSGKTKVSGEVSVGVGVVAVETEQGGHPNKRSLDHAALRTGTEVRLNLETLFRTTDLLMTQLATGDTAGDTSVLSVKKVMYRAQLTDWLCLRVAATGAQGADMAEALNPLEGQGLTGTTSMGSVLHRRCSGTALAATARVNDWSWLTVGHFVSGWGPSSSSDATPLCHSTLGQVTLRPTPECALALVGLSRHWPAPSLPSHPGLHWSEMGPLLLPHVRLSSPQAPAPNGDVLRGSFDSSTSSMNGTPDVWKGLPAPHFRGHALQSYGFAGAVAMGEVATLSGWAHADQSTPRQWPPPRASVQWGLTLSGVPDTLGVGWGLSLSSTQPEPWMRPADPPATSRTAVGAQTHMEAFLNVTNGKGFTLTPGAAMIKEGKRLTGPAFLLRSTWNF